MENKWHHRIPDLKYIKLNNKIVILSALVKKLWSNMSFYVMVDNVTRSHTSHVQTAQHLFLLFVIY